MSENDPLKDLNHLQRYLVEEYVEDYQERAMSRRQVLKYIAAVVGSFAVANTVLAGCTPVPAPTAAQPAAPTPAAATGAPAVSATPTPAQITATATQAVLATTATVPTPTPQPVPAGVRVPADDPAIEAGAVTFPGDGLSVIAYQAKPVGDGPFPAILVAHENRGLTD